MKISIPQFPLPAGKATRCLGALAAAVLSIPAVTHGATVVAPNAQATTLGNGQDNNTQLFDRPGDTDGQRYQQIYAASEFSAFGANDLINSIAFRAKQNGGLFPNIFGSTVTVSNIQIRLTTTQHNSSIDGVNPISGAFANNIDGAALTTVYSGSLTVTTTTAGTTDFGYVINLQTPFGYNKSSGNLLLDILIPAGATITNTGSSGYSRPDTQTGDALGANANDGIASAFGASADATIGANSTTGLVTRFTSTVPEPSTWAVMLTGAGLLGVGVLRRGRTV